MCMAILWWLHVANRDGGEFYVYSGQLPGEELFPVVFTIDRIHTGTVLHVSRVHQDASRD